MNNVKEKNFYDALERIFTGAKIEGKSGYVNLLKIKSNYYRFILQKFQEQIEKEKILKESSDFKEEFFDRLYDFFEKYFSESGSVYFVKTAHYQRVYEQVYTDHKDVILFWKTHMLYYVKSDILFKNIDIAIKDEKGREYHFYFDVKNLQAKQNNEKKALVFTFSKMEKEQTEDSNSKQTFIFDVSYSERGKKTKIDEIAKKTKIADNVLEKAFKTFKKQSEVDFFINKNAQKFLNEQLDLYLHQILLREENKFLQERLEQIKIIKTFAKKIIDFITQFENELVKIWNKPKFAMNSNYVITLDKLNKELLQKIKNHQNLDDQIQEWQKMEMIEENFNKNDLLKTSRNDQFLPIDTKHFKTLEHEILNQFDHLDKALDGRFIHSENYQALNTLQKKYKGKVQCIYIDPPFNLGKNADFNYKVNYKDSNWATLLENRLRLAKELLANTGSIFVRCDYNGNYIVRCLLDTIFGEENFRNEIVVSRGTTPKGEINKMETGIDFIFLFSKSINCLFYPPKVKRKNRAWMTMHLPTQRSTYELQVRKFWDKDLLPPKNRHWASSQSEIDKRIKDKEIRFNNEKSYIDLNDKKIDFVPETLQSEYKRKDANWTDIKGYSSNHKFTTENSEKLLERVIQTATQKNDIVLDFFMGSATTQAVAQKLGRKWLGVEMGQHFFDVDVPRLKQVVFGKQSGISKDLKEKYKGSGFFKYECLEQYEATLRNMQYKDYSQDDLFTGEKKVFEEYIFYSDKKFAYILDLSKDIVQIDFDKLYKDIDFAESLSNILGLPIKKITKTAVILQDGEAEKTIPYDYKNMSKQEKQTFLKFLRPLLWWGE